MRVLFLHHFPLSESAVGRLTARWAAALVDAGHEACLLVVDDRKRDNEPLVAERVVCHRDDPTADLSFELPRFSTSADAQAGGTFPALTDAQLAQYREQLRRRLDAQIDRFNPQVIHAQHIWVLGQLSVETGAPYLLSAWGPELVDYELDPRYRTLAEQAATNAGRILVPDDETLREVEEKFDLERGQALVAPAALRLAESAAATAPPSAIAGELVRLYQALLDARFGSES